MVLCNSFKNGGNPKSTRYVIINDETYVEFPEEGNMEKKRLVAKHLVPVYEKNSERNDAAVNHSQNKDSTLNKLFSSHIGISKDHREFESNSEEIISNRLFNLNCDQDAIVISDDDNCETGSGKLGELYNSSDDSHSKETAKLSLKKLERIYLKKASNETISESKNNSSNQVLEGKISKKRRNPPKKFPIGQRLLYACDGEVKLKISDHFPINRFNPKILLPVMNTNEDVEMDNSGKSKYMECPYCKHKLQKRVLRHLFSHLKIVFCSLCNDVMSVMKGYSLSHTQDHRANLRCIKCSFMGSSEGNLRSHVMNHHKDALLRQCSICGCWLEKGRTEDLQLKILVDHVKKKHSGENPHSLPWNFFSEFDDQNVNNKDIFHCLNCQDLIMTSLTDLLRHAQQHPSKELKKCKFCKFTHYSEVWMNLHRKTHSHIQYKCPYCKYKNPKHFTLKYHIMKRHRKGVLGNKPKNPSTLS